MNIKSNASYGKKLKIGMMASTSGKRKGVLWVQVKSFIVKSHLEKSCALKRETTTFLYLVPNHCIFVRGLMEDSSHAIMEECAKYKFRRKCKSPYFL